MKKILIMLVVIVSGLAGCSIQKEPNITDDIIDSGDVINVESDNIQTEDMFEEDPSKYKFSDDYSIDFNVWKKEFGTEVVKYNKVLSGDKIFVGEDISLRFEIEKQVIEETGSYVEKLIVYINDIPYTIEEEYCGFYASIIDLDENDNYKELYVRKIIAQTICYETYRIKKDGLDLMCIGGILYNEILNQYICGFKEIIKDVSPVPVLGYYLYKDGEFKYIDRFLNGEKIIDENGNLNQNFQNQVFTVGIGYGGINIEDSLFNLNLMDESKVTIDDKAFFLAGAKVKFLSQYSGRDSNNNEINVYDIEIVEDFTNKDGWNKEYELTLPAGTILKGVTSWTMPSGGIYDGFVHIEKSNYKMNKNGD